MTIDQELQKALDVDPSAEFLARVRTRIASEPVPQRWGFSWMFALAAAAAVIVVAAVMMRSAGANRPAGEVLASRSVEAITVPMQAPQTTRVTGSERTRPTDAVVVAPSVVGRVLSDPASSPATEPEIVIDQREAAALRRLLNIGTLRAADGFALTSVDEIQIEPLVIAPLESGGEGVRQ